MNESDWKLFQTLLPQWQEAYTVRLCDEYASILTGPYRGSDAFWEVKRLIRKDKKRLAAMAEVEKQEMPFIIAELLREQAITMDDLAEFSPGLRERVRDICSVGARKDSLCEPIPIRIPTHRCVGCVYHRISLNTRVRLFRFME